jgi:hypothetical protein
MNGDSSRHDACRLLVCFVRASSFSNRYRYLVLASRVIDCLKQRAAAQKGYHCFCERLSHRRGVSDTVTRRISSWQETHLHKQAGHIEADLLHSQLFPCSRTVLLYCGEFTGLDTPMHTFRKRDISGTSQLPNVSSLGGEVQKSSLSKDR